MLDDKYSMSTTSRWSFHLYAIRVGGCAIEQCSQFAFCVVADSSGLLPATRIVVSEYLVGVLGVWNTIQPTVQQLHQ